MSATTTHPIVSAAPGNRSHHPAGVFELNKLLLIDDHPLFRDGMQSLLRRLHPEVQILEAGTCAAGVCTVIENPDIDLVLLDLELPDGNGMEALAKVRESHAEIPVVVLSGLTDQQSIRQALERGAMGYVPKTSTTEIMLKALQLVFSGGTYVPPEAIRGSPIVERAGQDQKDTKIDSGPTKSTALGLTPRQTDILRLLIQGNSNKHICRKLELSEATVKSHMTAVLRALNVTNRVEAVIEVSRRCIVFD